MHTPTIGVLALQGCVTPHRPHIEAVGARFSAVKTPDQFDAVDGLILPGGESTTMLKLIDTFDLWDSLKRTLTTKPVWGICAGCILLAETVTNPQQKSFGVLPITVERNAYGRQLDSYQAPVNGYPVSFIRAPIIRAVDESLDILAEEEGTPIWVQSGKAMVTTFHPELTLDYPSPMHRHFVDLVRAAA